MSDSERVLLDEQKKIEIGLLNAIHDFCTENGLRYYLAYGTLLGAARHKGFIPWDDDIDVWMPRKDFEFFISHFEHESMRVISVKQVRDYYCVFPKVADQGTALIEDDLRKKVEVGVYVDIFPLDVLPKKNDAVLKLIKALRMLFKAKNVLCFDKTERGLAKAKHTLLTVVSKVLPNRFLYNEIDRLAKKYQNREGCSYTAQVTELSYRNREIMESECFGTPALLPFEGRQYFVPAQWDKVLRNIYGDYMQLPPKEKQVPPHGSVIYRKK